MSLNEIPAIETAREYLETYRDVEMCDYTLKSTYCASGRWKIIFDVDGIGEVGVRLDADTGNLASEEGHSKTSWNLR